jgi:PEP-CTERM motif
MKSSFAATVVLSAALLATGAAHAAAPSVVQLTGTVGGNQSAGISNTLTTAGSFEDHYTFSGVFGAATVNGSLSTLIISAAGADIDISSVSINGIEFGARRSSYLGNLDGREFFALSSTSFDLPLSLIVKGTLVAGRNGSTTGSYSATFNLQQAAVVPEPQTYALFGAGLLTMFALARRRQRSL